MNTDDRHAVVAERLTVYERIDHRLLDYLITGRDPFLVRHIKDLESNGVARRQQDCDAKAHIRPLRMSIACQKCMIDNALYAVNSH